MARTSLGFSIGGLSVLPLVGAVAGILLANIARREPGASETDRRMATVGLVLGRVGVVVGVLGLLALAWLALLAGLSELDFSSMD